MSFRLAPLEEQALAEDTHSDLPIRLQIRGAYQWPVDGVEDAEIEVRFDVADLLDLVAQARAAQYTLAQRARRAADRADAVVEATHVARGGAARNDVRTMRRVAVGLQGLPDAAPARRDFPEGGAAPLSGGTADGRPVGGDVRGGG